MDTTIKKLLRCVGGLAALATAQPGLAESILVPEGREFIEKRISVATDGDDDRLQSSLMRAVTVGVEGFGPWEASFLPQCTPSSLQPFTAPSPEPLATVRYQDIDGGYMGEGFLQFTDFSSQGKLVVINIYNHYIEQSRMRFKERQARFEKAGAALDGDLEMAFFQERQQLESQGLWAESVFWLVTRMRADWSCDIVVRVERVKNRCSMSARVSGDINGSVHGDVAYFNTFEQGVPLTTGSYADPEMQQMLQGWAGSMGGLAEWMAAQGHPLDKEDVERLKRGDDGFSEAQKELFAGQAELYQVGGDKFGLTLADTKFDAPTPTLEDGAMSDAAKQHLDIARSAAGQGDVEGALASILGALGGALGDAQKSGQLDALGQGIGAMAGLFTLEASSPSHLPELSHVEGAILLPLSSLVVAPGAIDDVGRVPFIYSKEHGVGQATLQMASTGENFIFGKLSGELYTEGTYSNLGRRGKIKVEAEFVALRGVNSCH